jgi:hypothetical protein
VDSWHFGTDPDLRIRTLTYRSGFGSWKDANKKLIFVFKVFFAYNFFKVHLHQSSKIKVNRTKKIVVIEVFLLIDGRIRIRTNNDGFESGRPKKLTSTDPTDPDPQH